MKLKKSVRPPKFYKKELFSCKPVLPFLNKGELLSGAVSQEAESQTTEDCSQI